MTDANIDLTSIFEDQYDIYHRTPSLSDGDSPGSSQADESQSQRHGARSGLPLLQLDDWDPDLFYDETPPTCIHYCLEWKLLLRKATSTRPAKLASDTEQNLVLAPSAYWERTLKQKLQQLVEKKQPRDMRYEPEETNITVSVTGPSGRALTKRADGLDITFWKDVEDQLTTWGHLFQKGKSLRITLSFIYKEPEHTASTRTRQGTRRGATGRQHAERADLIEDQEAEGVPTVWSEVYALMRCHVESCPHPYCWRDPDTKKHHPLDTRVLSKLVDCAEEGKPLKTHNDVPVSIRELLYSQEQSNESSRKRKRRASDLPPIHINLNPADQGADKPSLLFDLPWSREEALKRCFTWHCSNASTREWREGFKKAYQICLLECLDLECLYTNQVEEAKFLVEKGVSRGIALQCVKKIGAWLEHVRIQPLV
ncbi:uncharacterized protein CTRU02_215495 [Colletotrichum truncatum]|uniref:Uncharacterized protein n=1 Tax=Colletotrichum truncatum TaxID=5467 RepID=A0ACC3YCS5_COLTU|nr:uncharacterized protein CTRU02_05561 [Colletotrichum truncatum]KAF6794004.1 hypothetical protein CTRU02_05561 [Colletotrichum truncatum]